MDNARRPARRSRRPRAAALDALSVLMESDAAVRSFDGPAVLRELPVLPVRNTVLLPRMVVPLFVDREPALRAIEAAMARDRAILIVSQRSELTDDPTYQDVYGVGTECTISRVLKMPDGTSSVLVQGVRRVRIDVWLHHSPYGRVRGLAFDESDRYDERLEALARTALASFERCTKLSERFGEDAYVQALNIERVGALADFLVAQLEPPLALRQDLLETLDPELRLRKACQLLQRELNVLELEHKIHVEVQQEADRGQR
ncbi:MAG TPA: LON peptidase substrate-binding domain-containing protein, partial [Ktedonobacterales bacterium]|nr:LON peptidase substrate-binding domain-containing protein [Ktedonobacterales bacterium]